MKTTTTKFATVLMLAFGSLFSLAASATEKNGASSEIRDISASGNVHIYVTLGEKEGIKTNGYDANSSLVEVADGVLNIASYGEEELTVLVTVTDLESIEAFDGAFVQSLTDLGIDATDVYLHSAATAIVRVGKEDVFLSK